MSRVNITSASPFEALIGYSRAVVVGEWVFVSGTTGYDPRTGEISTDVIEQTEQALLNIEAALHTAECLMADVVRVQYIVPDRDDFPKLWPTLKKWFGEIGPAATMIQANLMKKEMKVEIEVTAKKGCGLRELDD